VAALAGALGERVRFERRSGARGPGGALPETWEKLCSCWADVVPEGRSGSAPAADGRQAGRRWRVTLRAGPEISLDMRMVWRGMTLKVAGIEVNPREADRLTLWVEDPGI
jgi:head-tail adaptor